MIIDDDLMIREVLTLLATEAGFEVSVYESGEAALEDLTRPDTGKPDAVLADMQMTGVCGDTLARLLRSACGPATTVLAMSGTPVPAERLQSFDGFLLKPFSIDDIVAALDARTPESADPEAAPDSAVLSQSIFDSLEKGMPKDQLRRLYAMSLDDADNRIGLMRKALDAGDLDAYQRGAHAIKGGCGMVGALELAQLAARMEESGPEAIDNRGAFDEFLAASKRLRRILDAQLA
jgi:CheY-like chemotaxis protein